MNMSKDKVAFRDKSFQKMQGKSKFSIHNIPFSTNLIVRTIKFWATQITPKYN